jgi:hypothetical protein
MFAQYLFLSRVQFIPDERINNPKAAKAACHEYMISRCSFRYRVAGDATEARDLEKSLKAELKPTLNP